MKRALGGAAVLVAIVLVVIGYLSGVGLNENIETRSTGNIVEFSNPAAAAQATQLESSFSPLEDITVRLEGLFADKGGLEPEELNLKIEITGRHRRRLFHPEDHIICSEAEMKEHIRRQLVAVTGDEDLKLKRLNLGYLSKD